MTPDDSPPAPLRPGGSGEPGGQGASAASSSSGVYKRASRKGAARRFVCDDCGKLYSRSEHLQRHRLNHKPKEVFSCDVPGCDLRFVRADLLLRHRKRHERNYIPRKRNQNFTDSELTPTSTSASSGLTNHDHTMLHVPAENVPPLPPPPNAGLSLGAALSVPDIRAAAAAAQSGMPASPSSIRSPASSIARASVAVAAPNPSKSTLPDPDWEVCNAIRPKPSPLYVAEPFSAAAAAAATQPPSMMTWNAWLFDPNELRDSSVAQLPYMEGGLESTLDSSIRYGDGSPNDPSLLASPASTETERALSDARRHEVVRWFEVFRAKQARADPMAPPLATGLDPDAIGDVPAISVPVLLDCLHEYFGSISPRMPIVHAPTFSYNRCAIFLLMVMIALGAKALDRKQINNPMRGDRFDYGGFADAIVKSVRWEILTAPEASPPVGLWVAQALLLLEYYEKMFSSRRFHERAHIYHSSFLTLLRRGSPLIGRTGSETPVGEPSADGGGLHGHHLLQQQGPSREARMWWERWAETESMHRVVFCAFVLDIVHAACFGHDSEIFPHEIRLPLPCDDTLWTASNPDTVRQLEQNLRMYGVRRVTFLDGLKRAVHGGEVKTHSFGRMIIMAGLLSVGWQLSHRETPLRWVDRTAPSTEAQSRWQRLLVAAFDSWKTSFDATRGAGGGGGGGGGGVGQASSSNSEPDRVGYRGGCDGPVQSAAVLYHLAYISNFVDIVDLQVFAGAKRLLGRTVSIKDYQSVVERMQTWVRLPSTRNAVLHAFQLLHQVLGGHASSYSSGKLPQPEMPVTAADGLFPPMRYSCRDECDPHRPWVLYYSALSAWAYARTLNTPVKMEESQVHQDLLKMRRHEPEPYAAHGRQTGDSQQLLHQHQQLQLHQQYMVGGQLPDMASLSRSQRVADYLSRITAHADLAHVSVAALLDGLADLLDLLADAFGESPSEILQEARERLKVCRSILPAAATRDG